MQEFLHVKPCPQATSEKRNFFSSSMWPESDARNLIDWIFAIGGPCVPSAVCDCGLIFTPRLSHSTLQEKVWYFSRMMVSRNEICGSVRPMKCNINLKWLT